MNALRTKFKKQIVAEFLPPARPSRKVIIFCSGLPSSPGKGRVLEFWSKKGYWSFAIRYRGTWESEGEFLKDSPEKDALDVIDSLPRGFKDTWSGKIYKVDPKEIFVIGSSFGGASAILASRDKRVKKAVALSPVVDWTAKSKAEPMDYLYRVIRTGYGQAFRFSDKNWSKLKSGKFYNPVNHINEINGGKLLIFHAKDDEVVAWRPVERFAKLTNSKIKIYKRGGHYSLSASAQPLFFKQIKAFFSER